jgi:hypothetical protein
MPGRDLYGAFSGNWKQDPREFDPRKCCRMHVDAYDGSAFSTANTVMRHANFYRNVAAAATITHVNSYDERIGNFFRLTAAENTAGSRAWISERVFAQQPALTAGLAEMDFQAMVRMTGSYTAVGGSVGFQAAHGQPGPLMYNQVGFECYESGGNWVACSNVTGSTAEPPVSVRVDTGIKASDWHALRVWVNKDATRAIWSIDDVVVRTENDPMLLPSWKTMVARGNTFADIVASQVGMAAAVRIRADDSAANSADRVDVNWILYRYFREYT